MEPPKPIAVTPIAVRNGSEWRIHGPAMVVPGVATRCCHLGSMSFIPRPFELPTVTMVSRGRGIRSPLIGCFALLGQPNPHTQDGDIQIYGEQLSATTAPLR